MNKVGYPICRRMLSELPLERLHRVFFHGHHDTVWNAMFSKIGADPALNLWNTFPHIGNLASACVPVAIQQAHEANDLRRGAPIATLVGSGGMSFLTMAFTC